MAPELPASTKTTPPRALEVCVEERHQRLVRPRLLGLRVDLVDQADGGTPGHDVVQSGAKGVLRQLGEVQLRVGHAVQRSGDLLDEVRLAASRRGPQQVVVTPFGGMGARLGDSDASVLEPLTDLLSEAHVRTDDREVAHPDARQAGDELHQFLAASVGVGGHARRML